MAYWQTLSLHFPGKGKKFTETSTSDISQVCNDKAKPADRCLIIWTLHCLRLKILFQKLDVFILSQKWEDNLQWWPFRKSCVYISSHQTKFVPSIYIRTVRNHLRDITELGTSKIINFSSL